MKSKSEYIVVCSLAVACSLLSAPALAIEIDFATPITIGSDAINAVDLEPFDFDGDGDVDLVGIHGGTNTVDLYLNDGDDANFTNVVLSNTSQPSQVAIADLNGDGAMDILYTDFDRGRVHWHENQFASMGGFSGRRDAAIVFRAAGVTTGDLDGDGDLDIVATRRPANIVLWIENQLNESDNSDWSSPVVIGRNINNAQRVAVADINADGNPDVVVGGAEDGGSFQWFDNASGTASGWVSNTIDAEANISCINVQDFDNDGNLDLIVQENNSPANPNQKIAIWLNTTGDGLNFTEQTISFDVGADTGTSCEMADLDFDGDFDLVGSRDGEWYDNIDGTTFTLRSFDSNMDTDHVSTRLFDMDGDGDQDVFTAQFFDDRFSYFENEFCNPGDPDFDLDGIPDACDDQIVIDDVTVNEGDSGSTLVTFTVTLQIDLTGSVSYASRAGTATAGVDYTSTNGTLAFITGVAGESYTVSVNVNGDTDPEVAETFFLDLQSSDFVINDDVGMATILNDDGTSISINDASISEGDSGSSNLAFTVSLAVETTPFTVPLSTSDGSAVAGSDYTAQTGSLSFFGNTGETQTFTVPITGDSFAENDENFFVILGTPSDASVVVLDDTGEGSILNDDTASVSIFDAGFDEADVGDGTLDFIVELSGSTNFPFQVNFKTNDGTATAGSDYIDNDGSLSFGGNDGEQRFIRVTVINDDVLEGPETLLAMLTGTSNPAITIATANATGTISDDDSASIAIADAGGLEGDADNTITLSVTLNGAVQDGFSVDYSSSDNDAEAGSDYTEASGTLNFSGTDGETQTLDVTILGDQIVENDETFMINLGEPSNTFVVRSDAEANVFLANDDNAVISIADVRVDEGNSGTTAAEFVVSVDAAVQDGFTVDFATADDIATAGSDYQANSGLLSFVGVLNEAQIISVSVSGDVTGEAGDGFWWWVLGRRGG
ncbi:MAG: Calx-beta domain-containing protein, partial [Pseudomonadota bacterium]